ncbi:MAG: acetyl-CoA carboxylase biotin carboxyl carrier protein subunit [Lewinellaceae bacterium]|nr:acetyl-CoA carboxylase biotin carboxyl carrier protein subunit [Lewinellaceae bacterium]
MEKLKIVVNDTLSFEVTPQDLEALDFVQTGKHSLHVLKGTRSFEVEVIDSNFQEKKLTLSINGTLYQAEISDPFDQLVNKMGLLLDTVHKVDTIRAPMPGLVLQILVQPGDEVKQGDALIILEAMKMENVIKSPGDGIVGNIPVQKGQAVDKGQVLIRMD